MAICTHDSGDKAVLAIYVDQYYNAGYIQEIMARVLNDPSVMVETPINPYELWFRVCSMNHTPAVYMRKGGVISFKEVILPKMVRNMGCFFMYVEAAHTHHILFRTMSIDLPYIQDMYAEPSTDSDTD